MPRRLKIDSVVEAKILKALRQGSTRRAAAGYGGVASDTFERMLKRSADFAAQVELAEAEVEVAIVNDVRRAIHNGDTAAAKFWLERRRPNEWGAKITDADQDLLSRLVQAFTRQAMPQPALPGDIEVLEAEYEVVEQEQEQEP
jgi:hypothetical protein